MSRTRITIASRSRSSAEKLAGYISGRPEFRVDVRVLTNGNADPLAGVQMLPDILLLHCGDGSAELEHLAENSLRADVPLIVCGRDSNTETMRQAMRAGARDYLTDRMTSQDLLASLSRIRDESARNKTTDQGQLIVVVNGKGGSGASMIATNLAHSLVRDGDSEVMLADLDLQFGGLCRYLDIRPEVSIMQALESVTEMDEVSADAYTCRHSSGLKLLAAQTNRPVLPRGISVEKLDALLNIYLSINDFVVVDAPPHLNVATELVFEKADRIFIVVQQSLPHIQDSARLMQILSSELGVPRQRVEVVVNRFFKNAEIDLSDIKKTVRAETIHTVPNQFKLAAESVDTGVPLAEISSGAALTKSIRKLQAALVDTPGGPEPASLARSLTGFLRR